MLAMFLFIIIGVAVGGSGSVGGKPHLACIYSVYADGHIFDILGNVGPVDERTVRSARLTQ